MTHRTVSRKERFVNAIGDWLLSLILTPRFYTVILWTGSAIALLVVVLWWLL